MLVFVVFVSDAGMHDGTPLSACPQNHQDSGWWGWWGKGLEASGEEEEWSGGR